MDIPGNLYWLAFICKNYYSKGTIDNLFLVSGANPDWRVPITQELTTGSERMDVFFSWHDGIREKAPQQFAGIFSKFAASISNNREVPDAQRDIARRLAEELEKAAKAGARGILLEPLLSTLSRILARENLIKEVAIVTGAAARLDWINSDRFGPDEYFLYLSIPFKDYVHIEQEREALEQSILNRIQRLLVAVPDEHISKVIIAPQMMEDNDWRNKALVWLSKENINNQGRVRSDNVAAIVEDGLRFRSNPEVRLYKALKQLGVSFAPLPVFVRGGKAYRRIEPDIVVWKSGVMLVIEIDGDDFHRETPAEAHNRITMLYHEGAHIERVNASECDTDEKALACANRLLTALSQVKDARR